jgi:hypothetical protein
MRKYLLLTILLSFLCIGARGQSDPEIDLSGLPKSTTAVSLRYWFDTDANSVKTASISGGATTIDASALREGVHTVHYQVVDSKDIAGVPSSKMFIKLDQKVTAKSKSLRFWFDTGVDVKTTKTLSGATTIDASALKEGVHTVHYQIVDDQGIVGITDSKMFVKVYEKTVATAKSLRYWFDTDANSVKTTTTLSGVTTIDASSLMDGVHTVHYQIVDNKDIAGIVVSKIFIKLGKNTVTKAKSLRYWFDKDMTNVKTTALQSEAVTIDASSLVEGIHMLHYQIVDDKGGLGCVVTKMFFKMSAKTSSTATAIRYWFDEDTEVQQVDVAEIVQVSTNKLKTNGSHELRFQLVDNKGEVSPVRSASFDYSISGDANQDGLVNVTDIVATVNYIMENPSGTFSTVAADVNKDGFINVSDIVGMVNIIMSSGSRMDQHEVMEVLKKSGFIFEGEEKQ